MTSDDPVWLLITEEAKLSIAEEPLLSEFYQRAILDHSDFDSALSYNLANQLNGSAIPSAAIKKLILEALKVDSSITVSARLDIMASFERDPACDKHLIPLLYFKGFQAMQLHRVSHWYWSNHRTALALFLQNQVAEVFAVDIHPGARIGSGIMIDHATGLVVGETAIIGDNVSILHSVTLGGSGSGEGDRHPEVGSGVMISAGVKIMGNVKIGDGVKVGAGSLVIESIPPHTTVVGVPARIVGAPLEGSPSFEMNQNLDV
ncbi:MAG: serine O-acetyltransferase [Porticoccaceae bacterium]|nr:serine O-acetyltransferase [Porticoccaceae bacterium]